MESILKDLDPRETYFQWFSQNPTQRPDGRNIHSLPDIGVVPNIIANADGSALVKFADTVIVAGVKSEVVEASSIDNLTDLLSNRIFNIDGLIYLVINFHHCFGARSDIKPGPPSAETQALTSRLSHSLKSTDIFDIQSMVIEKDVLCRVVYIDLACIVDNGCTFDAALLAACIALKNATFSLPSLDRERGMVTIDATEERVKLKMLSFPCSVTLGVFNDQITLLYPNREELKACNNSYINVTVELLSGNLLSIGKASGHIEDKALIQLLPSILPNILNQLREYTF